MIKVFCSVKSHISHVASTKLFTCNILDTNASVITKLYRGKLASCQLHMQFNMLMTADVKSTVCTLWYGDLLQMQAQEAEQRAEAVEAAVQQSPAQNPIKLYVTSALTAILSFAVVSGTTHSPLQWG